MSTHKLYPPLSDLIDATALPGDFESLETTLNEGIDIVLSKILYKDYQVQVLKAGEAKLFSIVILTKTLRIPLFSGMNLVFFRGSETNASEFDILFAWQWPLGKYIRNFEQQGFSYAPEAFADILIKLSELNSREEFFSQLVLTFLDDGNDNYLTLFNDLISEINLLDNGDTAVTTEVQNITTKIGEIRDEVETQIKATDFFTIGSIFERYKNSDGMVACIESIRDSFDVLREDHQIHIDLNAAILNLLLQQANDLQEKFRRLLHLFKTWMADIDEDDIKNFLLPQFSIELQGINVALEFPRNWLIPAIESPPLSGDYIEDPNPNNLSAIDFTVGNLRYSTKKGFEFEAIPSFTFEKSFIGNTGIMLEFINLKVDMSKTKNIPEADEEGRAEDFRGMYAEEATVTLPAKWFKDVDETTAEIKGRDLLIGTGGISGELELNAKGGDNTLWAKLGKSSGFRIGFKSFYIKFRQNTIEDTKIHGVLTIPVFKDTNGDPADIHVKAHIQNNGDWDITASEPDGFKELKFKDIFSFTLKSIFISKEGDDFCLGVSGTLKFLHPKIKDLFGENIEIEKLKIWSDGRIEIEGGVLPLVKKMPLKLGPVDVEISAISFGSHQQEHGGTMRKYNFFGFSGGVDINPGGVSVRGDDIKFYYTIDDEQLNLNPHRFLKISSLKIDLIIPGDASKESAVALIKGFLAVKDVGGSQVYQGEVKFDFPKMGVGGKAAMTYTPSYPAWLFDAELSFAKGLPIGSTGIQLDALQVLVGNNYVATKTAIPSLTDDNTWYDYYKYPPVGVHVSKFSTPDESKDYDSAFSAGAGAAISTMADQGKAFSAKLFLLLSLPELILLEGKAAILGEKITLASDDPPFFAFIAFSPGESIEIGLGADYELPKDNGRILDLYAEVQAKFFFKNSRAWYVNFGTEDKPITARVLSLFNAYSFLMLSASGIKAGAGVDWAFNKKYAGGMVRASVQVYIKVGGQISFEKPQIGAYAMVGGHVNAYLLFMGFYIGIDTSLSVEAAKPFLIQGSVRLCVGVTIGFWKFKKTITKCFNVEFIWEKNNTVDTTPIMPIGQGAAVPVGGVNILSGETFSIGYFGTSSPSPNHPKILENVIPIDTYVDFQASKGLDPNPVIDLIGGVSNPPEGHIDLIPPKSVGRQVRHEYSIEEIELKAWNGNAWVDYHPYEAMAVPSALAVLNANSSDYKLGFWQKTGLEYNVIRLLSQSPLNYMTASQPGIHVPEQFGMTSATLFCEWDEPFENCVNWKSDHPSEIQASKWNQKENIIYRVIGANGKIASYPNHFGFDPSVCWPDDSLLEIFLVRPSAQVELTLSTSLPSLEIDFFQLVHDQNGQASMQLQGSMSKSRSQLIAPVKFDSSGIPISKIVLRPQSSDQCDSTWEPGDLEDQLGKLKEELEKCKEGLGKKKEEMEKICEAYESFKGKFEHCFVTPPLRVGYEIYQEVDDDQIDEWRWRLRDAATGKILLSSSTRYFSIEAAVEEMEIALAHGTSLSGYQLKTTKDDRQYFNIIDSNDEIVGRRIEYFQTDQHRHNAIEFLIETLTRYYNGDRVQMPSYQEGREDCPVDIAHFNCWQELAKRPDTLVTEFNKPLPSPGIRCSPILEDMTDLVHNFCEAYNNLYAQLYDCNLEKLRRLKKLCQDAAGAYQECLDKCNELEELVAQIIELISWLQSNPQTGSDNECRTCLHQVCYVTIADQQLQLQIPSQDAIQEDYSSMVDSVEKMLAPVWRPNTKYYGRVKLADKVNGNSPVVRDYYFGFRTAGPLGYWHEDPDANYIQDQADDLAQYALTNLKAYIDYDKSYPNPDGNLINAKPLFYKDPRILLFYNQRYTYHHFGNWPAYNGLPALSGKLEIVVKDPVEDITIPNPPPPHIVTTEIPQATVTWPQDQSVHIPEDLQVLMNMSEHESCLLQGGLMIKPASVHTEVIPQYLKPLKLYNAIVNNLFEGEKREVHKFVFQTSRYGDFEEQVLSYQLQDDDGNHRSAVFADAFGLDSAAVQLGYDIINGTSSPSNLALATDFPEPFERVLRGAWELPHLPAPISTEFNIIQQESSGNTIAILIRNPEPFNDPKMPESVLQRSLAVIGNGSPDPSFRYLHSKDRSQILVMNNSKNITNPQIRFRFKYLEWDGDAYIDGFILNVGPLSLV